MTVCNACEGEMLVVDTCLLAERPGVALFGEEPELLGLTDGPERCHDCNVARRGVHHIHCCVAACERCADQRLVCGCDEDDG